MADSSLSAATVAPRRVVMQSNSLPAFLRLRIWASQYLYLGKSRLGFGNVVRLPFKKVIKLNTTRNEADAMDYVRINTSVPIPKVYEVYEQPDGAVHIVMEDLPGNGIDYTSMTPDQIQAFGKELSGYLQQLRSLEPPEKGFIGSVYRESAFDPRVGSLRFGPFHKVADFHSYLRLGRPLDLWLYDPVVKTVHGRSGAYRVKFTHADLSPTNIQYHNGRIMGIIDWECAGWYPEYREYTKMWFINRPEELKAERDIWRRLSPWAYDDFYEQPKNMAAFNRVVAAAQSQDGDTTGGV